MGSNLTMARLALLIQGLLEQLPTNGEWTRQKAEKWIDMIRLTFDIVYDFPDEPRTGPQPDDFNVPRQGES